MKTGREAFFDNCPDAVAGPSSLSHRSVVSPDPLAAFVCPVKDVTAAVCQWLDSSFPDAFGTGWSGGERSRRNRDTGAAVSSTFAQPCYSAVTLSSDLDCDRETESFPSSVSNDVNGVISLSESFPARETPSLAPCGVATALPSSLDAPKTSRTSMEDLQLLQPLSLGLYVETKARFTSAALLTEEVLFQIECFNRFVRGGSLSRRRSQAACALPLRPSQANRYHRGPCCWYAQYCVRCSRGKAGPVEGSDLRPSSTGQGVLGSSRGRNRSWSEDPRDSSAGKSPERVDGVERRWHRNMAL
ncbi:hypothetical protein MRX96_042435 [Rhipicephalus microplus]